MSQKVVPNKPLFIMLYGFPGAGKTFFARQMTDHLQCAHVQGDKIRFELFEEPRYDKQENSIVDHLTEYMVEEFLTAGISIIYDTNAMRRSQRLQLREMARKRGAQPLLVWFQLDADTAFARLQKRDRRRADDKFAIDYSFDEFKRIANAMQHPQNEDYVVVSGKHTFVSQKNAVFKKLMELGLIDSQSAQNKVAKPGLVNLVPKTVTGRVDMNRRNINIR
jgi:predicted kinase